MPTYHLPPKCTYCRHERYTYATTSPGSSLPRAGPPPPAQHTCFATSSISDDVITASIPRSRAASPDPGSPRSRAEPPATDYWYADCSSASRTARANTYPEATGSHCFTPPSPSSLRMRWVTKHVWWGRRARAGWGC